MRSVLALVVLFLSLILVTVSAMHPEELSFNLRVGDKQCLYDSYLSNLHVVGEVIVVDGPPDMTVSYAVRDMGTGKLLRTRDHVSHDKFSFNAPHVQNEQMAMHDAHSIHNRPTHNRQLSDADLRRIQPMEYQICFTGLRPHDWKAPHTHDRHDTPPLPSRKIFLNFREGHNEHRISTRNELKNSLTRKTDLDTMRNTVDQISRQVRRLAREIDELRYRENLLAESGEHTASRIYRYSLLACASIAFAGVISTYSVQTVLKKSARR